MICKEIDQIWLLNAEVIFQIELLVNRIVQPHNKCKYTMGAYYFQQ